MPRCKADPACPFPAGPTGACDQHAAELELPFTLHETSCGGSVRALETGEVWQGFSVSGRNHSTTWDRKLRVKLEELTPEQKRRKYGNTYCKAKLENGVTCNEPIPLKERICDACKERLLPTAKNPSATP